MKSKFLLVAVVMVALAAASLGLLRDRDTTQATHPKPVQPFAVTTTTGVATNQLGGTPSLQFDINIDDGTRLALPTFYADGFPVVPDKDVTEGIDNDADTVVDEDITDGVDNDGDTSVDEDDFDAGTTVTGTVTSETDTLCDNTDDILAKPGGDPSIPEDFVESTTNVDTDGQLGTDPEDYVRFSIPPLWSLIARQRADLKVLYINGDGGSPLPLTPQIPLTTTIKQVPWMPGTVASQTTLAGDPGPPSGICQDTPQNSLSTQTGLTQMPAPEGDSGGVCDTGSLDCADKGITAWYATPGYVATTAAGVEAITVHKQTHNNGPEGGSFLEWWDVEAPAGVTPVWTLEGGDVLVGDALTFTQDPVPASTSTGYDRTLTLTCTAPGSYLVALKNILYPVGATDQYLDNNAATFMVQIECGDVSALDPVDKEVIWVKPVAVDQVDSTPNHLQLVEVTETATVTLDELKVYHPEENLGASVNGDETLVAEADPLIEAIWSSSGTPVLTQTVAEPSGEQVDVVEDLEVTCLAGSAALTQPQPVVVKAIDRPGTGLRETRPGDNVAHTVIKVWCFADGTARTNAADGTDDGTGLYPRWTLYTSAVDYRKDFDATSPTALRDDTAYMERLVIPECFWIDGDDDSATLDVDADGFVSAIESQADADIPGTGYADIDSDGDCLIDPAFAQPSHKVDSDDELDGALCPAIVYSDSGGTIQVQYDTAADQDCDGLTDGIENGWGSDPTLADTDGDGASDFQEMAQYTNPRNPDTDYDGIWDKPEDDYVAAAQGGAENEVTGGPANDGVDADDNCPSVYNPSQANNDGQMRTTGASIPGSNASNPYSDTEGDACDTDDDNDDITDVAELRYSAVPSGSCTFGIGGGLDPLDGDTDDDHTLDGVEIQTNTDPCVSGATLAAFDQFYTTLFRGGGFNVPDNGSFGGVWDAEHDGTDDGREADTDADTLDSKGDAGSDVDNDDFSAGAPAELRDIIEVKGYNTYPAMIDSDGDGCADWIEIVDVNGDRTANILDVVQVAQTALAGEPTVEPDLDILDLDRNHTNNILDVQTAALNSSLVKAHSACGSVAQGDRQRSLP